MLFPGNTRIHFRTVQNNQGCRERVRALVQQLFEAPGAWFSNSLELKSHTKFKISKQTLIRVQLKIKKLNNFLSNLTSFACDFKSSEFENQGRLLEYYKNKPCSTESGPFRAQVICTRFPFLSSALKTTNKLYTRKSYACKQLHHYPWLFHALLRCFVLCARQETRCHTQWYINRTVRIWA
jgi:hypothetical protein